MAAPLRLPVPSSRRDTGHQVRGIPLSGTLQTRAIASNEYFGTWTKTFTDPRLGAAIVDRLTFGGNIVETGTDSYRLAQTRARAELDTAG